MCCKLQAAGHCCYTSYTVTDINPKVSQTEDSDKPQQILHLFRLLARLHPDIIEFLLHLLHLQ